MSGKVSHKKGSGSVVASLVWPVGWFGWFGWLAGWPAGWLVGRLWAGWLVVQLACSPVVGWSVGLMAGCGLVGRLAS